MRAFGSCACLGAFSMRDPISGHRLTRHNAHLAGNCVCRHAHCVFVSGPVFAVRGAHSNLVTTRTHSCTHTRTYVHISTHLHTCSCMQAYMHQHTRCHNFLLHESTFLFAVTISLSLSLSPSLSLPLPLPFPLSLSLSPILSLSLSELSSGCDFHPPDSDEWSATLSTAICFTGPWLGWDGWMLTASQGVRCVKALGESSLEMTSGNRSHDLQVPSGVT